MSEVDRLLDEAFLAYNNKDLDEAEELARSVLTLMPSSGDGLYLLGLIAAKKNAFEPAEKLLYQAVQLYPENKQYKLSLGFVLEKQGRLDEALSFYEPFKEDAYVLSQIGFIYLQKGLLDFAKSAFDKGLSLNEEVLTAYIGLALIFRREGNFKEALSILEKGLLRGTRLYVHLSRDAATATEVGKRHGTPTVLRVDAARMVRDGYAFYLSENGVWLTVHVPKEYLSPL